MSTETRWKQRPPGSNWGDFGADDQCGRINLLTPAKVREGDLLHRVYLGGGAPAGPASPVTAEKEPV